MSSKSLPEVSEKWDNSECKDCPIGDKSLYRVSGKPCLEKKRIVMKGSFCAIKPKTVQNERENKP